MARNAVKGKAAPSNDAQIANDSRRTSESLPQVQFPSAVTARQRAVLHQLAEASGLPHTSIGEGTQRRICLGNSNAVVVQVSTDDGAREISDAALCAALAEHLHIDGASAFAATSTAASKLAARSLQKKKPAASAAAMSLEDFVAMTGPLLDMERDAEMAQSMDSITRLSPEKAQAKGHILLNLRCSDTEGGLLGRTLLTLVSQKGPASGTDLLQLPQHKFTPHDVVNIRPSKGDTSGPAIASGIVYRVRETSIVVAVDEPSDEGLDQPLRLEKLANTVTYQRLQSTLGSLSGYAERQHGGRLTDIVFGAAQPRFQAQPPPWKAFNTGLDKSQQAAVSLALASSDVSLIHGPPGTGKTTALVEAVLQEVKRGNRVLVAAASNIAVDNVVERLARHSPKTRVLRLGHPARLLPEVLSSSLEAHVLKSDNSALAKDCRKEIISINSRLGKLGRKDYSERRSLRSELRQLQKEERTRQQHAVTEVVRNAQVVCATLTGVLGKQLEGKSGFFDVVYIDEAAQALEIATWGALLMAPRAVLAGDHLQLPPTITSDEAAAKGLGRTLFERLQQQYGQSISALLTTQYRMHHDIMAWSSNEFYGNRLTAHESVAAHDLNSLKVPDAEEIPVLLLVDTAGCCLSGCDMEETAEEEGDSTFNSGEAQVVLAHAAALVEAGIRPADIGVITPYNAQVTLLRQERPETLKSLEISSVDGFQGREKEAIIISAVRSNSSGTVGFLSDSR